MADSLKPLVAPPPAEEAESSHSGRFRFAYVALGIVFWISVAMLAVVLLRGAVKSGPPWSAWKPSGGSRVSEATQIAGYVAPRYHLGTGPQLVAVQAHAPEIQNVPLAAVAIRGASGSNQDVHVDSAANAIVYVLCGLGNRCSIATGKASVARARLLRREALELALYTFKYDKGVDSVVALLPPPPNKNENWSLYFRRADFQSELGKPLVDTLPNDKKLTPTSLGGTERSTVERLTRPRWFKSQFQQLQDGDAILVLDPLISAG